MAFICFTYELFILYINVTDIITDFQIAGIDIKRDMLFKLYAVRYFPRDLNMFS